MNTSPIISQSSKLPTPGILSCSTDDLIIKRKCIIREKPIKSTTFNNMINTTKTSNLDSPYLIASDNLNSQLGDESPKNLNDR